jgi:hypothetical protein
LVSLSEQGQEGRSATKEGDNGNQVRENGADHS